MMVSNRKLNRAMLVMALVLNAFLVWLYWTLLFFIMAYSIETIIIECGTIL
jgi:hypothetical protein